jgi:hypothetical protein
MDLSQAEVITQLPHELNSFVIPAFSLLRICRPLYERRKLPLLAHGQFPKSRGDRLKLAHGSVRLNYFVATQAKEKHRI